MKTTNGINERIKECRIQLHLSQEYIANYLGINRASYSQIELGNRKVSAEEISKLSILFEVPVDSLLYGEKFEIPSVVFARSFESLDEDDKAEIINLIRFKTLMKAQKRNDSSK